jgi:ABC-2 type transport system ATP-binding protein
MSFPTNESLIGYDAETRRMGPAEWSMSLTASNVTARAFSAHVAVQNYRPEAKPAVQVRGLTKRFPARRGWRHALGRPARMITAVDRVSFDVNQGELFGLIGPNGAGKTTLLKMLSTLIEPDAGTAFIAGADLATQPALVRARLSPVIADERSVNWRLSAGENLRFYGSLYGLRGAELRSKIHTVLAVVGLEHAGSRMVGTYSSGMRQRLLIARAMLVKPAVLLLDEPTRSLDPVAARDFRAFLRNEITRAQGCTILLATHEPEEGLGLCDRVAVLDGGRVIATGATRELMERVQGGRYRVRTRDVHHRALLDLGAELATTQSANGMLDSEWVTVEVTIRGGEQGAHQVLRQLIDCGVEVSGFEKVQPTLAELIEQLLAQEGRRNVR